MKYKKNWKVSVVIMAVLLVVVALILGEDDPWWRDRKLAEGFGEK